MSASARLKSATTGKLATMVWMASISDTERSGHCANALAVTCGKPLAGGEVANQGASLAAQAELEAVAEGGVNSSVEDVLGPVLRLTQHVVLLDHLDRLLLRLLEDAVRFTFGLLGDTLAVLVQPAGGFDLLGNNHSHLVQHVHGLVLVDDHLGRKR